ncbi:hypothetical protein [Cellulophaga sp. HaHaR_3_176]|uniref:hypothetical protein n=1 Tax=Cellulophaga sp. HaHaR_3_176 TaxID=1942464 RepID=UPI0020B154A9|nr:hypothetical protein [Cellulophaga sp. HaHaR_3_176]
MIKFIVFPLIYLFKLKDGLNIKQASKIIGNHFPEVEDKLVNLLDLKENQEQSDLLLASIEQKSKNLSSFDFSKAIDYKEGIRKLTYLAIPIIIICLLWFSGNFSSFFGSYDRVVNYDLAFEKPAPFSFQLLVNDLTVQKGQNLELKAVVEGEFRPELVYITIDGENFLMNEEDGVFYYTISAINQPLYFKFISNDVQSKQYSVKVIETPSILDFNLVLKYPNHLKKRTETIKVNGSTTIPEGTQVSWLLNTEFTNDISLTANDTVIRFAKDKSEFKLSKTIYNNFDYTISTSNTDINNFENLAYSFKVIKDAYPSIRVSQTIDSLNPNIVYYSGAIADDYGLKKVQLVYYESDNPNKTSKIELLQPNTTVANFYYTFPSGLQLVPNINYNYYFQVTDNDVVNRFKTSKSQVFSSNLLDVDALINKDLENQQSILSNLDKSLNKLEEQAKSLNEINNQQKEKSELNFNDKKKVNNFLEKQELQEKQMEKFSKQLKENLDKNNKDDELNKLLQERLERQELEAKKNQKLLEDLKKVADKINKDELSKKLEEIAKNQKNSKRNLEQILELTKRYYVTEKASQLAKDLEKLAEKQDELSKSKENIKDIKKEQEGIKEEFNKISDELNELKNDNSALKKPLKLDINESDSENVKQDHEDINSDLNSESNDKQTKASKKQKAASDKMKEMAQKLQQSSSSSSGSSVTEDAEVLRQILDNLILFTFKQEALIETLNEDENSFSNQSKVILEQQELKELFNHIDDSLFALSLRVPEISEKINKQVTEVFYNTEKSIASISDANLYQGVSYQKYTLTSGNILSDLLADILDNMQESMQQGKGEGQGQDFQLPDIIKSQGEIGKKMGEKGSEGKAGDKGKKGESGKSGKEGSNGQDGQPSNNGTKPGNKSGGKDGEGSSGTDGKGEGNAKGDVQGKGKTGNSKSGNGSGNGNTGISEDELKEIYEIYKQQEIIKKGLEEQLNNMINNDDRQLAKKLIHQMSDFQNTILESGITRNTIDKATIIQYELLKLEGAALKKGEKKERESKSNNNSFTNPILSKPPSLENYNNENEILNRQALPLQQNFQNKIKDYFKQND